MTETHPDIAIADSVTKLGPEHRGKVLIGGSHGGVYAGYLAAKAGARAVILNDAGIGKDEAGCGSLAFLDGIGMAAATVDCRSARIGDGDDMAANGRISRVNETAAGVGCQAGQSAMDCAHAMLAATAPAGEPPVYEESRFLLRDSDDGPKVWGIDSVSLVRAEDAGQIVIAASHGGLLGGDPTTAIKVDALAAVFSDAGVGKDGVGITRLPAMDARGIAGATVDCQTARIGDARSVWETGVISHINDTAAAMGAAVGMTTKAFADCVIRHVSGQGAPNDV